MLNKMFFNYLIFLIFNFTACYIILKLSLAKKSFFLRAIITKKKSDLKMHSYLVFQNAGFIIIGIFIVSTTLFYFLHYDKIEISEEIPRPYIFIISLGILFLISFYDFKKGIHPIYRLVCQILVVFLSLTLIKLPIVSETFIPLKLQYLFVIIFWVYIINITNFVDGLDGLIGFSTIGFFLNILIYLFLFKINSINVYISLLAISVLIPFLIFNKPKAKIFLNDLGSIPLGYIVGYTILNLCQNNQWYFALSIFLYFILDVTLTLVLKIKKGHYPWARMFDYLFLQPVIKGGKNHWYVLRFIIGYYLIMMIVIYLTYQYNLHRSYILLYSFIASILILLKFKKFLKN